MHKNPRILILRGGAIGDFIVTLPALQALRRRWPEAFIELLGYPHVARLALGGGLVNTVRSLDEAGMARFFAPMASFDPEQVNFVRSFDLIVSWLHDPDEVVRNNFLYAGARQVISGTPLVQKFHACECMLKPLEELAIYSEHEVPRLDVLRELKAAGCEWLRRHGLETAVTAIHPGSGSPRKNWAPGNFIQLARALRERGKDCFFILGEADAECGEAVRRNAPDFPVLDGCGLEELAGTLAHAALYLGNDSGITHLAAALGMRVIALYGPTDPALWGARGREVVHIQAPGGSLNRLEVGEVLNFIE
ncbi:MAG TPA: glycosyltransferase family 9 protein [Kiritimatiellia bacterium]|nr:glycosyltransferase family 9 protein [Kiritimatiellia bacterium]HNS81823.1 glycosyltransferase family 9 protein [Kiritimatiellia bacterium]